MYELIKNAIKGLFLIIFFVVGSALGIDSTTWLILLAAFILWPFIEVLVQNLDIRAKNHAEKLRQNRLKNRPPH